MPSASKPVYARIPEACRQYGVSRSRLYQLATQRRVTLKKLGNATLVHLASLEMCIEALPEAEVAEIPEVVPLVPRRREPRRSRPRTDDPPDAA